MPSKKKNYVDRETVPKEGRGVAPFPYKNHSWDRELLQIAFLVGKNKTDKLHTFDHNVTYMLISPSDCFANTLFFWLCLIFWLDISLEKVFN